MQADIVSTVLLPGGLAIIMFSLGIGLGIADFRRVFASPRAFAVGALCHFVLLPLVAFAVVKLFGITGALAVGFMIIAACPTGTTSNLLTWYARGDVALAVSFTAVASVVSVVTVPFILGWSLEHFMGGAQAVTLPASRIIGPVFIILAIPVGLGMLVRALAPALVQKLQKPLSVAATLIFVVIIAIAIYANWRAFREQALALLPMLLTINLTMLALGFGLSRVAGVDARQAATVAIESSVQNGTLAIVIASSILKDGTMSVPGAIYGVMMYFTGIAFVVWMRRTLPARSAAEQAADQAALH